MTNKISKVEKCIKSKETLKFEASIDVPISKPNLEVSIKREDDNRFDRNKKKSFMSSKRAPLSSLH